MIKLIDKKPELHNTYIREMGRKCSRTYKKNLKRTHVRACWLAILFDTIIASGESGSEAFERAKKMVPEDEAGGIYIFRHEGRDL